MNGTDEDKWVDRRVFPELPLRLTQGSSPPEVCQQRQQRFTRVEHSSCGALEPDDETHQSFAKGPAPRGSASVRQSLQLKVQR